MCCFRVTLYAEFLPSKTRATCVTLVEVSVFKMNSDRSICMVQTLVKEDNSECTHMPACSCACVYACTHTHTHAHAHTHAHTHMHAHTHAHINLTFCARASCLSLLPECLVSTVAAAAATAFLPAAGCSHSEPPTSTAWQKALRF